MDRYMKRFIEKYDVYDKESKTILLSRIAQYIEFYDITNQEESKKIFISEFNKMLDFGRRKDKLKNILNEN
jgi:hypothetical protein